MAVTSGRPDRGQAARRYGNGRHPRGHLRPQSNAMTTTQPNCRARRSAVRPVEAAVHKEIARPDANVSSRRSSPAVPRASDEALLQRVAAGNGLAMQVLFARHQVRVYRFVLRRVGNAAVAEELTSDVFLDVWQQAGRFEGRSAVSTWLLAIARFKALAALRRQRDEALDERTAAAIEDPADDPQLALEKKDRSAIVRKCLTGLSAEHREIIDLVYYHQKSTQEVAEIVGIPVNTVKTRMFYARRRLSALLQAAGIAGVAS